MLLYNRVVETLALPRRRLSIFVRWWKNQKMGVSRCRSEAGSVSPGKGLADELEIKQVITDIEHIRS